MYSTFKSVATNWIWWAMTFTFLAFTSRWAARFGSKLASAVMRFLHATSVIYNLTNDKFIVLFTDRLTSFVCGIPIKSLNSTTVANAMYQYLCFYPSPKIVQVDGGPEYSGRFQQLCDNYQILVKTSIPRSSQTNGTVESSVKSIKNILTKICAY